MSDKIGTFWIVSGQNAVFNLGDAPRSRTIDIDFNLTEENFNSWATITLMARNVTWEHNRVILNGHFVGFLDPTHGNTWSQQTLIVEVYGQQLFGDGPTNTLRIESYDQNAEATANVDDFELKHIVFAYRTNR